MEDNKEFSTVVLAALLHDIGKLLQRGSKITNSAGRHPVVGQTFVRSFASEFERFSDADLLAELVLRHHRGQGYYGIRPADASNDRIQTLATLVSYADGLSASERGDHADGWQQFRQTPLVPIFERLFVEETVAPRSRLRAVQLGAAGELTDAIFVGPHEPLRTGEMDRLLEDFGLQCSALLRAGDQLPDAAFSRLLALLQRSTWAVASDTQEVVPDVSLFDHLKTTAALAACLYVVHQNTDTLSVRGLRPDAQKSPEFCLLTGDLSGVQSYIFDIATGDDAGKGTARRLRARSFSVQMLAEAAAYSIVQDAGLTVANVLSTAGGKFQVLLPYDLELLARLHLRGEEWGQWFMDEYRGELSLNLVWHPFDRKGLEPGVGQGFSQVLAGSAEQLRAVKAKKN